MIKTDETLEQLVADRRGYKYLSASGVSPYQDYQYDLSSRDIITTKLNKKKSDECGAGWNLATVRWIMDNCMRVDGVIVEFSIPDDAVIVVPTNSDGKFRTDKVQIKTVVPVVDVFPVLANLRERLDNYVPVNPITATGMSDANKIIEIMASVWAPVGASVWDSVRDSVGASVGALVWASVWASVGALVWDSVWDSVRASVRDSVGDSVWAYCFICGYYAVVKLLNLDYHHPVFDLIDMGVMVVPVKDEYWVYGYKGALLGKVKKND